MTARASLLAAFCACGLAAGAALALTPAAAQDPKPLHTPLPAPGVEVTLTWDDLLPEKELMQEFRDTIAEHDYLGEGGMAALQTGSAEVRKELDNRKVRLPGYIVPMSIRADGTITEFFVVPYYGACIHVPPPPPNQIVYGRSAKGFDIEAIHEPYWLTGTLRTQSKGARLGTAAYTMDVASLALYEY